VPPRWRSLLGLILALGAALRIGFYLSRPSLSIDETMLGLELGTRSYSDLLQPLDYAQTAPFPFLWSIRLSGTWFGMNEFALRALPLLAGLAVPVLVWRVGRRLLPETAALAATGLAAFAPTLVEYSVTVKPYITDAAIALILVEITLGLLDHPEDARRWWLLGAAGLLAVVGSVPAPFLLAGVAAAIIIRTRDGVTVRRLTICLAAWAATFLPLYLRLYRPVAMSDYMQLFWGGSFFEPLRLAGWRLLGRSLVQALVARPAPLGAILALTVLLGVGWWWLWRRRGRPVAALCGVPLLGLLAASVFHRYPLTARLLLFTAPALLLGCAAAIAAIGEWRRAAGRVLAWATVLLLAGIDVTHPYRTPATRAAIAALISRAGATEPVYLSSGTIPAWAFYTTDWSAPDTAYLRLIRQWVGAPEVPAFRA
jgi:4-amino-4-deoxy-L-arabinose transferase-like glycosyltransferase